ncbi:MAG: helix-turn-helix domain-containing protein [Halioglobus sp.]|nr:helix-turn-helix domain-containing protein [Halioglobus sp.]
MHNFLLASRAPPLASHKFLDARTLADAERALETAVEPRRFVACGNSRKNGIQINRYQLADVQIFGMHFDGPLKIASAPLESVNVIIPIHGRVRSDLGDESVALSRGRARVDSPGGRVAVEWESSSTSVVTRIPRSTLQHYCRKLFDLELQREIRFAPTLDFTTAAGTSLLHILNTILLEADAPDSLLNRGVLTQAFQETLVTALLSAQPHSLSSELQHRGQRVRPFYIKKAVDYIHANLAQVITLTDLVEATGVSLRSLQSGFARHYNLGPRAFITQCKMRRARAELLAAKPIDVTVADVAAKWGFYNPGNFGRNYQKLFGERPSETLRR